MGDRDAEGKWTRVARLKAAWRGPRRLCRMLDLALAEKRTHSVYVAGALSGSALAADQAAADRAARLRGAVGSSTATPAWL